MLAALLETFIYAAIYITILKWIENPTINIIKTSGDINEILRCRKKILKIRKVSFILYMLFVCLPLSCIACLVIHFKVEGLGPAYFITSYIFTILGCYLWVKRRTDHNPLSNIYDLVKNDVTQSPKPYVLFLRSFEKDDYTPEIIIKTHSKNFPCFSEYHFTHILNQFQSVYAVGMTKEIEAPTGAKRVYLSDLHWQDDVRELMERADFIVILLDDRPSCIWEIEQTATMLHKTIYIVDNVHKYNRAAQLVAHAIHLPTLEKQHHTPLALYTQDGSHFTITPFEHNKRSYRRIIKTITEDYLGKKFRLSFLRRLADNRFVKIVLTWAILIILSALLCATVCEQTDSPPLEDSVIAVMMIINLSLLALIYYGFLTNTRGGMVLVIRRIIRWILLIIAAIVCTALCTTSFPEYENGIIITFPFLFLAGFALIYHKGIMPAVAWLWGLLWRRSRTTGEE